MHTKQLCNFITILLLPVLAMSNLLLLYHFCTSVMMEVLYFTKFNRMALSQTHGHLVSHHCVDVEFSCRQTFVCFISIHTRHNDSDCWCGYQI